MITIRPRIISMTDLVEEFAEKEFTLRVAIILDSNKVIQDSKGNIVFEDNVCKGTTAVRRIIHQATLNQSDLVLGYKRKPVIQVHHVIISRDNRTATVIVPFNLVMSLSNDFLKAISVPNENWINQDAIKTVLMGATLGEASGLQR